MAKHAIADEITRYVEGGLAHEVYDRGKETVCGISRKWWPNWEWWPYIDYLRTQPGFPKNIPYKKLSPYITEFYRINFWNRIKGDLIPDQDIANQVYDTAVNSGVSAAGKDLQFALNRLNRNQTDYPDIKVDGKIGAKTIRSINNLLKKRGGNGVSNLIILLFAYQIIAWDELVEKDSTQAYNINGWLYRQSIKIKALVDRHSR